MFASETGPTKVIALLPPIVPTLSFNTRGLGITIGVLAVSIPVAIRSVLLPRASGVPRASVPLSSSVTPEYVLSAPSAIVLPPVAVAPVKELVPAMSQAAGTEDAAGDRKVRGDARDRRCKQESLGGAEVERPAGNERGGRGADVVGRQNRAATDGQRQAVFGDPDVSDEDQRVDRRVERERLARCEPDVIGGAGGGQCRRVFLADRRTQPRGVGRHSAGAIGRQVPGRSARGGHRRVGEDSVNQRRVVGECSDQDLGQGAAERRIAAVRAARQRLREEADGSTGAAHDIAPSINWVRPPPS